MTFVGGGRYLARGSIHYFHELSFAGSLKNVKATKWSIKLIAVETKGNGD